MNSADFRPIRLDAVAPRAKCWSGNWATAEVGFPGLLLLFTVNGQNAQVGEGSVYFSLGDGISIISTLPPLPEERRSQTN